MSEKFIKIKFCNAKFFQKNIKTKDFVANLDINSKGKFILKHSKRVDEPVNSFKEPITVHQVSNVLHTLIGERPVPSFRKTFYKRNEDIFNLALDSFVKIDSPIVKTKRKGEDIETFISEMTKLDKMAWNSWSKPQSIQWFKIEKFMGEHFEEFVNLMNESLGYNVLTKPFESLIGICTYNSNLNKVIDFLNENKKTPLVIFFSKFDSDRSEITRNTKLGETVLSGIDYVNFLSGEIIVPYNEDFANMIVKNSTNILDGGYAEIVGVFYQDELEDVESFIPIREISDEKY